MKSGTVEYGLKTNRKTLTTLIKRCVGSLTTAHRKFIRHNMSKDYIRQLQNMAIAYVERCLRQEGFANQKVVKQSGVMDPGIRHRNGRRSLTFQNLIWTAHVAPRKSTVEESEDVYDANFALMTTILFCWSGNCANKLRPLDKSAVSTFEAHYDPTLHLSSKISKFMPWRHVGGVAVTPFIRILSARWKSMVNFISRRLYALGNNPSTK